MGFNLGVAVVIGASILGIVVKVPERWFHTDFTSTPLPQGAASHPAIPNPEKDGVRFEDLTFSSSHSEWKLHGWTFTPSTELSLQSTKGQFPMIIMGHGIGATKDMGLFPFAMQFAKSGFMVLVFDYLHFGNPV